MRVIDSHVHVGTIWAEPVEVLLFQMKSNGVSNTVLIGTNGYFDHTYLIECLNRYPGVFKAAGSIDPQAPDRVKQLEAFYKAGGSGVRINIRSERAWDPDNSLFKAAGERGMIVSVIGRADSFASARFKKLLDDCPNTHFNLEHLLRAPGKDVTEAPYAGYKEALECAKWPNTTTTVPGLGEILIRPPGNRPNKFPWEIPPHYAMAKEAFGAKRMMWGSNFPPSAAKEGYRNTLEAVRNLDVFKDGDDLEWVLGKTAAKVWGFKD
jgi:L-fuconolactonase